MVRSAVNSAVVVVIILILLFLPFAGIAAKWIHKVNVSVSRPLVIVQKGNVVVTKDEVLIIEDNLPKLNKGRSKQK